MKLLTALRLGASSKVAFVGAGGKTSGIFLVARQLLESDPCLRSVLISTTTHIGLFQAGYADHHIIVDSREKILALEKLFPAGSVVITGVPAEGKNAMITRVSGIPADDLLALANIHNIPLLIEADGAKMLPLKAPADYEPVIPEFVSEVVVIAALSGLGKPLCAEWVHRPEIFAELSGLTLGEKITPQALVRLLKHPLGGLKNIPPGARRSVLFNQAQTEEYQSVAREMASSLLEDYHAVLVGSYGQSLAKHVVGDGVEALHLDLITQENQNEGVISTYERTAGIILAAGGSQRYGQPKQLLVWQGQPLISHVAKNALEAGLSPVIVVTGAADGVIREALRGLPVQFVHNPNWQEGQSTSVKAGLTTLPLNIGACMFLLADQPRVTSNLLSALIQLHAATLSPITAPQVAGQRANPVLFDRVTFHDLMAVTGDQGGKVLFSQYPTTWLEWQDKEFTLDIDTPEDYQRLLQE